MWKPRGFNGSFSSLTRSIWFSLGYRFWNKVSAKLSFGLRSGPYDPIFHKDKIAAVVANGFDFTNPNSLFNSTSSLVKDFSETDVLISINYPVPLLENLSIAPEIGYTLNYGGLTTGLSLVYFFESK